VNRKIDVSQYFETAGQYAVFRPPGHVSVKQAAVMTTTSIALAREQRIGNLLIDLTGLTGLRMPSITERDSFGRRWAEAAEHAVRVAFVTGPIPTHAKDFAITAARDNGLTRVCSIGSRTHSPG
jgi:hypothetical protein